ncbi:5-methyltetrahydropteroyltriglutamate--homocysteine S-methyltransferase [Candidatus Vidania fulgoroideorum]
MQTHILGSTKIDSYRKLKFSIENFLNSKKNLENNISLICKIREIKNEIIKTQKFLDITNIGIFPYYDKVLTNMFYLGIIPYRYIKIINKKKCNIGLKEMLNIAKGNLKIKPLEMTKWFNTNYHYLVPELNNDNLKKFYKNNFLKEEFVNIEKIKNKKKFALIGPITFIKISNIKKLNKKSLYKNIFKRYINIIKRIKKEDIDIIQFEEPYFKDNLKKKEVKFLLRFYNKISKEIYNKIMLTCYFYKTNNFFLKNIKKIKSFGIHIKFDFSDKKLIKKTIKVIKKKKNKVISLGISSGRSIWVSDFEKILKKLKLILKKNLFISFSSSLEHIPFSIEKENNIPKNIKKWLCFYKEKIKELINIKKIFIYGKKINKKIYNKNKFINIVIKNYNKHSDLIIKEKSNNINKHKRKVYKNKIKFPTTTIGSFPQTKKIRSIRKEFFDKKISYKKYENFIKRNIKKNIRFQEKIGIDVLVHGEPERNDMVEFFCDKLNGFIITKFGWVHSYGTRCVKPPILFGTVIYKKGISIRWVRYYKKITNRIIKGIITGPITILKWSFIRKDIKLKDIAIQIGLALRKEVILLKKNGIKIIQIDEPAFKECMPTNIKDKKKYVNWSSRAFKILFCGINNLQIHTHICYSKLNKFDIKAFNIMDIDVISIECARSFMKILKFIKKVKLNFELGLGVFDIHSNYKFKKNDIYKFTSKIYKMKKKNIWINPDCGLKTRKWKEIINPLKKMVWAAKKMKKKF